MNIVIFSKDRACQLDLLIRSIKQLWVNWQDSKFNVIYTYSKPEYSETYAKVMSEHHEMIYHFQTNFKNDLCSVISDRDPYTTFFVDDQVLIDTVDTNSPEFEEFRSNKNIMALSLRLYPGINFCYPRNMPSPAPEFIEPYKWDWKKGIGDFGYPYSVDTHILRTSDILFAVTQTPYSNPNTFEDVLVRNMVIRPLMTCFKTPKVVNNPCNKVGAYGNRHGAVTAEYLNTMYMSGKRIDLQPILGMLPNSCHQEFDYKWL